MALLIRTGARMGVNARSVVMTWSSFISGALASYLVFRLPQWACGPFRADKAAEWSAVVVGFVAALATIWAVIVALRGGRQAIASERALRDEEHQRADDLRKKRARVLAGLAALPTYSIAAHCAEWRRMLSDPRFGTEQVMKFIVNVDTRTLDVVAAGSESFEYDAGLRILRFHSAFLSLQQLCTVNIPMVKGWDRHVEERNRHELLKEVTVSLRAASRVHRIMCALSGDRVGRPIRVGSEGFHDRVRLVFGDQ